MNDLISDEPYFIKYKKTLDTVIVIYNSLIYHDRSINIKFKVTFYLKNSAESGKIKIEYGNINYPVSSSYKRFGAGIVHVNEGSLPLTSEDIFVNNYTKLDNTSIFNVYNEFSTVENTPDISNKTITISPYPPIVTRTLPDLGVFSVTIPPNPTTRDIILVPPSLSTGSITYTSDSSLVTIVENILTANGSGTVTITATQAVTDLYYSASIPYVLDTSPLFPETTFTNFMITIPEVPITNSYTITPSPTGSYTYESENTAVATFKGSVLSAKSAGETYINVTKVATGLYPAKTERYLLVVRLVPIPPLSNYRIIIPQVPTTRVYTITPLPSDRTYTYESSNDSVGTITAQGVFTAVSSGTVTITVTRTQTGAYSAATDSYLLDTSSLFTTLSDFSIPTTSTTNYIQLSPPRSNRSGAFTYTSSSNNVEVIGSTLSIKGQGPVTITATQAAVGIYESASISAPFNTADIVFISDICFPAGTPVETDQGIIEINKLKDETIDGKRIVYVTRTQSADTHLVCIEKDAFGKNVPCQKTVLTQEHCVEKDGLMVRAAELVNGYSVYKQKYRGEKLYNVLMEEAYKMKVNNMVCETLDPENPVAKIYKDFKE
jgi:hypothetical protein